MWDLSNFPWAPRQGIYCYISIPRKLQFSRCCLHGHIPLILKLIFPVSRANCTCADIVWWCNCSAVPHKGMSIAPLPPPSDIHIYTNALTLFGIGITFNNKFALFRLTPGWKSNGWDIGWAEAIAVELVVHWLVEKESTTLHWSSTVISKV